jgi:hypothetical protein
LLGPANARVKNCDIFSGNRALFPTCGHTSYLASHRRCRHPDRTRRHNGKHKTTPREHSHWQSLRTHGSLSIEIGISTSHNPAVVLG